MIQKLKLIFKQSLLIFLFASIQLSANSVLENEFVKIIVNNSEQDQGRFSIETTQGDPLNLRDDNQLLIYGRPIPWTSYTTVRIDNQDYIFGSESKKTQRRTGKKALYGKVLSQINDGESIVTSVQFDKVIATQTLRFFRSPSTRVKDNVLISYTIQNLDNTAHEIGIRIMLDTKLGRNDGAPFRIGSQEITSELQLNKNQLEDYWMTFDNLSTPNVIAQGTLKLNDLQISPPDKLLLSNWGTLVDNPWEVPYQEGRSFIREGELEKDTALGLYWLPETIEPSSSRSIKTLYGLGEISLSAGELSLGLTAPKSIPVHSEDTYLIMAYIYNSGGFDAHQTKLEFELPKGVKIVSGESNYIHPILKSGETLQIPIKIALGNNIKPGLNKIGFRAFSSTLETNYIEREIIFSAPPTLSSRLFSKQINQTPQHRYFINTLELSNFSHLPIKDIQTQIIVPKASTLVNIEEQKKKVPLLEPNEVERITWLIKTDRETPTESVQVKIKALKQKTLHTTLKAPQHTPKITFSLSDELAQKGDYIYIDLEQLENKTIQNEWVSFTTENLEYIRTSYSPLLSSTPNITIEKNTITLSNLNTKQNLPYKSSLAKIHFRIKSEQISTVSAQLRQKIITKSILIKE